VSVYCTIGSICCEQARKEVLNEITPIQSTGQRGGIAGDALPAPVLPVHEHDATEKANLKLVLDWWREGLVAGHSEVVPKYFNEDVVQHNPNFPQGRAAIEALVKRRTPVNPIPATLPPDRMPAKAFAKGDYVVLIWDREAPDPADPSKKYAYNDFDAFRIQNGKIQEHWDGATKNPPAAGKK
jgi:predicted SnoaL-like aldol condensation-catalyzing enzyme